MAFASSVLVLKLAHLLAGILANIAPSFNFPFTDVMAKAEEFANGLWPVFLMPVGLIIGIGVLNYVIKAIRSALSTFS